MTLIVTSVSRSGVWQAADHRLTDLRTGTFSDTAVKTIAFDCDDAFGFISYTGRGEIGPKEVSELVRRKMRGEFRDLKSLVLLLADLGTKRIGTSAAHSFIVAALRNGTPAMVVITNMIFPATGPRIKHGKEFQVFPRAALRGSVVELHGSIANVRPGDYETLVRVANVERKNPADLMKLMAKVISNASMGDRFVSQGCLASYYPPNGGSIEQKYYGHPFGPAIEPPVPPTVAHGVDLTEVMQILLELSPDLGEDPRVPLKLSKSIDAAFRRASIPNSTK